MELLVILFLIIVIALVRHLLPSKGKIGERRVAFLLRRLPKNDYKVINNLLLLSNGRSAQIDHVVVSIYGIFVIETKNYSGWIYGGEYSEYWTQNIFGKKYSLRNPIYQNLGHVRALKFLLKGYEAIPFISIVAFSRQASLGVDAHTPVVYWDQILRIINQFENRVLTNSQVKIIFDTLLTNNATGKSDRKQHLTNVSNAKMRNAMVKSSGHCPQCNGELILRDGKYGRFYGCSNYPKCKFTSSYY